MTLHLVFSPPALPYLLSGDAFSDHLAGIDPRFKDQEAVRLIATQTDSYNRSRSEYDQRNAHYAEWIQWSNDNPDGTEQLLAFLRDHRAYFDTCCETLESIEAAMVTLAAVTNLDDVQAQIGEMCEHARTGSRVLSQNIEVISAAQAPEQPAEKASDSGILPQKRPSPTHPKT